MYRRDLLRLGLIAAAGLNLPLYTQVSMAQSKAKDVNISAQQVKHLYATKFATVDGQSQSLEKYLGKPLILNFWATWCPPCVKEMPDLDSLQQKYSDINVVGLAVDTASNVIKFNNKVNVSYPLLVAGHAGIKLMKGLGNSKGGLPYTLLFDAYGKSLKQFLGQVSLQELDEITAQVIGA